jgi:hypothetical protein
MWQFDDMFIVISIILINNNNNIVNMSQEKKHSVETHKSKLLLNTLFWGFILWLFGYVLGIVLFAFVPTGMIGWYIFPLGIIAALWVLLNKINRESLGCYIGLGVVWTIMAIALDYVFIVMMLKSSDYYKLDVYLYYILTLLLPIIVGWIKINKMKATSSKKV